MNASRLMLVLITMVFAVANSTACVPDKDDCVEVGKWEFTLGVGLGLRTNPLEGGDDIPLLLIPQVNYNGERFFIQNLDLGVVLFETEQHQFNLFITPSYDQLFFDPWKPTNYVAATSSPGALFGPCRGMCTRVLNERDIAGLGGFEYNLITDSVDIQFQYVSDFTQVHEGDEARLSVSKSWVAERLSIKATLGTIWQSSEVTNYYYGITQPEADARGTYQAEADLSYVARADWNYKLSKDWDLRFIASYRLLADEIYQSPLVEEKGVTTVFVGGVYHF